MMDEFCYILFLELLALMMNYHGRPLLQYINLKVMKCFYIFCGSKRVKSPGTYVILNELQPATYAWPFVLSNCPPVL